MENPIQMDDLGVPLFLETSIFVWRFGISGNRRGNAADEEMVTNLDAILHLVPGGIWPGAVDCVEVGNLEEKS